MEAILGLIMIYTWFHSVVIIVKKLKEVTTYETAVLFIALGAIILFVLGSI